MNLSTAPLSKPHPVVGDKRLLLRTRRRALIVFLHGKLQLELRYVRRPNTAEVTA